MFNYLTDRQIRYAIDKLINQKYLVTGNYNKIGYDRTKWYSLTNKAIGMFETTISHKSDNHLTKLVNGKDKSGEPIPDTVTLNVTKKKKSLNFKRREKQYNKYPDAFKRPNFKKFLKDL